MNYITEKAKNIPLIDVYETIVAGGGIAGISAALAAARSGAKVLLVETQYLLGGLATAGLITKYLPLCDGMGKQVSFGIAEELLRLSIARGYEEDFEHFYCPNWFKENSTVEERKEKRFQVQYNPYVFAILAEQLLIKEGVKILYGSSVCDVAVENSKITIAFVETPSGRECYSLKNIIDCTGDADICRLSGENTVTFKQGNIPASWYYETKNGENKLNMVGFCDIPDNLKTPEQLADAKGSTRFTGLDARELTELTLLSHKTLLNHFLKGGDISTIHSLSTIASIPQIRMTRRIDGVYTQDDSEQHKEFENSVGMFSDWRKKGPVYELPFTTLYGKKISNLITAGRLISVTEPMWDITRVIPVCAVSGQAAGTAAAMTDDFSKTDIKALQDRLKKDGVILHETEL